MQMTDIQKRMFLFLVGCMGTRLALVWIVYKYTWLLPYMGVLAIGPAIGFMVIYFGGLRKTGPEVFGKTIWWDHLRPVHGLLYGLFAYLAIMSMRVQNKTFANHAWKVLLVDVIIGFVAFTMHHVSSNKM